MPPAVADLMAAGDGLGLESAVVVANPLPVADQLDPALHDAALDRALAAAERGGLRGKEVSPFLLAAMVEQTGGLSLEVNLAHRRAQRRRRRADRGGLGRPRAVTGRRVLVVGDVVDDVLVRPLGATAVASDTEAEIDQQPGGSAANVAAWLGHTGADVVFVGRVGAQDVRRHTAALAAYGVDVRLAADDHRRTAAIVLLVDPAGERTMYVDRGANAGLVSGDVPGDAWRDVGWLHLTGYTFFDPAVRAAARHLVEQAVALDVQVSVDPSSSAFLRAADGDFIGWVEGASLLTPNLDEAVTLSGRKAPEEAARALLAYVPEVVVTCGRDGVLWMDRRSDPLWARAISTEVIDTTGAGDAFCAGLLAARARGASLTEQLEAGVRLAAEAASRLGGRPPG